MSFFPYFVLIMLSAGSVILAFNVAGIKRLFSAILFALGVSIIEYWVIGVPFGLTAYAWGFLFIITIVAKLIHDRNADDMAIDATVA
jgi:hypothetical protein